MEWKFQLTVVDITNHSFPIVSLRSSRGKIFLLLHCDLISLIKNMKIMNSPKVFISGLLTVFFLLVLNVVTSAQSVNESMNQRIIEMRKELKKEIDNLREEFELHKKKPIKDVKDGLVKITAKSLESPIVNNKPRENKMVYDKPSISRGKIVWGRPLGLNVRITSPFGNRTHPIYKTRSFHKGIDLACPKGTPVFAANNGRVVFAGYDKCLGNYVKIDHGVYQTIYGHLQTVLVRKGQSIKIGVKIGLSGSTGVSTGPHLHFALYKNGKAINPISIIQN